MDEAWWLRQEEEDEKAQRQIAEAAEARNALLTALDRFAEQLHDAKEVDQRPSGQEACSSALVERGAPAESSMHQTIAKAYDSIIEVLVQEHRNMAAAAEAATRARSGLEARLTQRRGHSEAIAAAGPAVLFDQTAKDASWWTERGGDDLEEPLREGWVQLVRASWLVELSKRGGVLCRRQDLPQEALVGLDELKAAGHTEGVNWNMLRIIVVSYPWLQPDHPDPHGESLRVIAAALKACVWGDDLFPPTPTQLYGVLIDFTALFQVERTEEEKRLFKLALPSLNFFYSHPHTMVLKVRLPPGYPDQGAHRYALPAGANTVAYADRGWCFAESAMSGLVKQSSKFLDLGLLSADLLEADPPRLDEVTVQCNTERAPPLHPKDFRSELEKKTFTSKKADFNPVAQLYTNAFTRHLGSARTLEFFQLGWGTEEARKLAQALRGNNATGQALNLGGNRLGSEGVLALAKVPCVKGRLRKLILHRNSIGPEGASALAEALLCNNIASLHTLDLHENSLGSEGAAALAGALRVNTSLSRLNLMSNGIGSGGAAALAGTLHVNTSLGRLDLGSNDISWEGVVPLAEALRVNASLRELNLKGNDIGWEGAAALAAALHVNTSLGTLDLENNDIGSEGAVALAGALHINTSLSDLCLRDNDIRSKGAAALAAALRVNASLRRLGLGSCGIGPKGAVALAAALRVSTSLATLRLDSNAIGVEGAAALAEALRVNRSLEMLDASSCEIGPREAAALGDAARESGTPIFSV